MIFYFPVNGNIEELERIKPPFDPYVITTLLGISPLKIKGIGWAYEDGELVNILLDFKPSK